MCSYDIGMDYYLSKPINKEELKQALKFYNFLWLFKW
jgi:CheY-like chemotaxis protein